MNINIRHLNPMEQVGILVAAMVIMLYAYLNVVCEAPSRKMQRIERKYEETRLAVEKLRQEKASGRIERDLAKLQKKLASAGASLREAERVLTAREETDVIATKILHMVSEEGFMIQNYARITDKNLIHEALGGADCYELSCYSMTLRGRFALVVELLRELQTMPTLVVVRKVLVEAPSDGSPLQTEIWFSL